MQPEVSDEQAKEFWLHCADLEMEQACKPPIDSKNIRTVLREGTSPFVLGHQFHVQMMEPDNRMAAKLSHDTIMLRAGLAMGFIDPFTGQIR